MLAAIAHPPHLAGICPVVTASNYHEGWTYQGGAFEQWFNESWTSGLAQGHAQPRGAEENECDARHFGKFPLPEYSLFEFADGSPESGMTHSLAPYFLDWLAIPTSTTIGNGGT